MRSNLTLFEDQDSAPGAELAEPITPPRIYRAEILRLRSAEQRREALSRITDPRTRAAVRFYIEDHFARLHQRALPDFAAIERQEITKTNEETQCK